MPILFYKVKHNGKPEPYGCFSNFSPDPVEIYGKIYATSEHAFQALKFNYDPALMEIVRLQPGPRAAAEFGRNRANPLRSDWESKPTEVPDLWQPDDMIVRPEETEPLYARVKDVVMYEVCLAKFSDIPDKASYGTPRDILLGTGDQVLIEDSAIDSYWGWGKTKTGQNKLGRILMAVRHTLRKT